MFCVLFFFSNQVNFSKKICNIILLTSVHNHLIENIYSTLHISLENNCHTRPLSSSRHWSPVCSANDQTLQSGENHPAAAELTSMLLCASKQSISSAPGDWPFSGGVGRGPRVPYFPLKLSSLLLPHFW